MAVAVEPSTQPGKFLGRVAIWALAALAASLSLGCNSLTGADELGQDDASEFEGGGSGGAGGAEAEGELDGDPIADCSAYPDGPFGKATGDVVDDLVWQGFPEHAAAPGAVRIGDYFDCTGERGIHALLLITVSLTCEACQEEAAQLNGLLAGEWAGLGVRVVSLVLEDPYQASPGTENARKWRDEFDLRTSAVVADPGSSMIVGVPATPLHVLVDPRTMAVVDRREGVVSPYTALLELAADNADLVP